MIKISTTLFVGSLIILHGMPMFAATSPPVTLSSSSVTGPGFVDLELTVTSHTHALRRAQLDIREVDDLLKIDVSRYPLFLPKDVPVTLALPFIVGGQSPYGSLRVAILDAKETSFAVQVLHFERTGEDTVRQVTATEFSEIVVSHMRAARTAAIERRALELFNRVLSEGRTPARSDEDTEFARAWNRLLEEHGMLSEPEDGSISGMSDCGPYVISPNNYVYPLVVRLIYEDLYEYYRVRVVESGYLVNVYTTVELVDGCGNVAYSSRSRSGETVYGGDARFDNFLTSVPPGSNPLDGLEAKTPDVGVRVSGTSEITLYWQYLPPSEHSFYWAGTEAWVEPTFRSANSPYPFFFRYNEEARSLQRRWSGSISSAFTDFRAGYDASYVYPVAYERVAPGLVVFRDDGRWITRWVMAHEFGHHLQFRLQGNVSSYGGIHDVCWTLVDLRQSLGEGFANWHASQWETQGVNPSIPCLGGECYSTCADPGYAIEGNVYAFLWDIFDYTNDATHDQGIDSVFRSLSFIANWDKDYVSFLHFYNDFLDRGLWGDEATVTDQLRVVNRVHIPY
jgi:hypothetical protein